MVSNLLNFLGIAGDYAFHNRVSLAHEFRTIFVPVLPSAVAGALLCVLGRGRVQRSRLAALGLLAVVLFDFQYLLRELLLSQDRAERLAALQLGVLTTMVETLALRDRMTARHSAAVARYARAMAIASAVPGGAGARRTPRDCSTTSASSRSRTRSCSPPAVQRGGVGARQAPPGRRRAHRARVEGYGPVADIVLCHHERWDGGLPGGVGARRSRCCARMISVADAYDVLTARDSYRQPVPPGRPSRSCAGGRQPVRPELVEMFGSCSTEGRNFGHADAADSEAELGVQRACPRIRRAARLMPA